VTSQFVTVSSTKRSIYPQQPKLWLAEELLLCGFKHIEVTNFGNPSGMPQFQDADELFKLIRGSRRVAHLLPDAILTAITIREKAIERAIQARKAGYGSDRILLMVSTSESHQYKNSGLTIDEYFRMAEEWVPKPRLPD
jgi:hydroxymethylglutaryl-CoA lyase